MVDNDIATLLKEIGIMEKTDDGIDVVGKSEVVEDAKKLFGNEETDAVQTSPPEPLIVRDMGKGTLLNGTFIRLRDIGGTSQVGLVRCIQEKDRSWLPSI